jgi:hypothetical protein
MRALWMVNLILVLNRSVLNREHSLMNVLKALALIVPMCSLHIIFLSKVTPRYFTLFTNGMSCPFTTHVRSQSHITTDNQLCRYVNTSDQAMSKGDNLKTCNKMEVEVYSTNLENKTSSRRSLCNNEWRISEINLVHTSDVFYRVEIAHSRLKSTEINEEYKKNMRSTKSRNLVILVLKIIIRNLYNLVITSHVFDVISMW